MIYTAKTTVHKGKPVSIVIDGARHLDVFYLDRRRRIYREYVRESVPDGYGYAAMIKMKGDSSGAEVRTVKYSHRCKVEVVKA
jgi:hypothetical protein